jgi:hypothetical protein
MKNVKSEKAALSAVTKLKDLCVSTIGGEWRTFHERLASDAWRYWVSLHTPHFVLKIWPMSEKEYTAEISKLEMNWEVKERSPFEACLMAVREIQKDLIPRMELCAEFGKYMNECPASVEAFRRTKKQETRPDPVNRIARKVKT